MYIVYKLIAPNGKPYIGYTGNSLTKRLSGHKAYAFNNIKGRNTKMSRAIRKYPLEKWSSEILFECETMHEACIKEQELIKNFDSIQRGYNTSIGGESSSLGCHFKFSKSHKKKLSLAAKKRFELIDQRKEKNPFWSGWWVTPWGKFTTILEATTNSPVKATLPTIYGLCKKNKNIISKFSLRKGKFVTKNDIGKTYKEIGFDFIPCMNITCEV